MPIDKNAEEEDLREGQRRSYTDYDCPSCNANNPVEMPLRDGDEIFCNYCGAEYKVRITDDSKLRFKEL